MTWLARRRPLLHERLQPFTNLHILGGGGWEGALNFCSSLASQRGFWILPFEKWAKFNTVSIEHCVSPLSTFTHSFSVSDGGQGVSSGLRLGRTEGDPLWAAPTRLYGCLETVCEDHSQITDSRGCDFTPASRAHILGARLKDVGTCCWKVGRKRQSKQNEHEEWIQRLCL